MSAPGTFHKWTAGLENPLHTGKTPIAEIISLGAGVQSSCLAVMADRQQLKDRNGKVLPKPDYAIFADTGWEPPPVYEHLEWLKTILSFPVVVVKSDLPPLRETLFYSPFRAPKNNFSYVPAFIRNPDGTRAMARRQCTDRYKIRPQNQWVRRHIFKLNRGDKWLPKMGYVKKWMGISADEWQRARRSWEKMNCHRFPLLDENLDRARLLEWWQDSFPNRPLVKSACVGCPYHSDAMWKEMREKRPADFADACKADEAIRHHPFSPNHPRYLHSSLSPLRSVRFKNENQTELDFGECEGMCGV